MVTSANISELRRDRCRGLPLGDAQHRRSCQVTCLPRQPCAVVTSKNVWVREAEVRAAIAAWATSPVENDPPLLVPEMALCQAEARIDLAVVGDARLIGWEIKTRTDRLARLPRQQQVYSKVFDRMWLAADERHIERALAVIPNWWGVVRVDDRDGECHLTQLRASRLNRDVDLYSLVRLLWRDEVLSELVALDLAEGRTRTPKRELWVALANAAPRHISASRLRGRVRARLMARGDWRVDERRR